LNYSPANTKHRREAPSRFEAILTITMFARETGGLLPHIRWGSGLSIILRHEQLAWKTGSINQKQKTAIGQESRGNQASTTSFRGLVSLIVLA
jgi:hypothetical protein